MFMKSSYLYSIINLHGNSFDISLNFFSSSTSCDTETVSSSALTFSAAMLLLTATALVIE